MRYRVIWDPVALNEFADLWVRAPDQQALADAADGIDLALRHIPLRQDSPTSPQSWWLHRCR